MLVYGSDPSFSDINGISPLEGSVFKKDRLIIGAVVDSLIARRN